MISFSQKSADCTQTAPSPLGEIAFRIVGSGPRKVVLWPSIFTDSRVYDGLVASLSGDATFYLIDGPGHGASPGLERDFTMSEAVAAWLSVMDAAGLSSAVVGGVSWGGLVAAEVALAAPERVEGLILMNTPMDLGSARPAAGDHMIAFGARWLGRTAFFRAGAASSVLGPFFGPGVLARNPAYREAFYDMLRNCDPARLAAAIRSVLLRSQPLRPRLPEIAAPTLLIAGEEDTRCPFEAQASAALEIADVRFQPVPGRHVSPIEAPEPVAEAIGTFLREVA